MWLCVFSLAPTQTVGVGGRRERERSPCVIALRRCVRVCPWLEEVFPFDAVIFVPCAIGARVAPALRYEWVRGARCEPVLLPSVKGRSTLRAIVSSRRACCTAARRSRLLGAVSR